LIKMYLDLTTTVFALVLCGFLAYQMLIAHHAQSPTPPVPRELIPIADLPAQGNPHAHVALLEFADFQCPFCAAFVRDTWPTLHDRFVSTGRLQLLFAQLPLSRIHPLARHAAEVAACAARQHRFWPLHDALFANPASLDANILTDLVTKQALDVSAMDRCQRTGAGTTVVAHDIALAAQLHITSTPSFIVGELTTDGVSLRATSILVGARPTSEFVTAITAVRNGSID
jgi:protein-disulfide isomerase